jgi:NADPH:quinone reductase-like Zn-dependent oxidoreductase
MMKRLTVTGSTLRGRSVAFKAALAAKLQTLVWPLLESGEVKPIIHATLPLAEAAAAHRLIEEGRQIGKIILTP